MNGSLSDFSVLIPWRGGDPQRERVWGFIRSQWDVLADKHGLEIVVGEPTDMYGPFNCSSALNNAYRASTRDNLIMFGADCLPDEEAIFEAAARLDRGEPWVPVFKETDYFNKDTTDLILAGEDIDSHDPDPEFHVPFQTGVIALKRYAYYNAGGFDERFIGWGAEDSAFRLTLYRLYGDSEPVNRTLRCLWHESGHRSMSPNNRQLITEYEKVQTSEEMTELVRFGRPQFLYDERYE